MGENDQGSRIGGSIQVKQGGSAAVLASHINGDIQYDANSAYLRANNNRVDGSIQVVGNSGGAEIFRNRINNYIYGRTLDEVDGLQLLQYSQADATFTGIEGQVRQRLNRHLGITLFGDTVRARL